MCPAGGIDGSTLSASGAAKTSCKPGSSTAVAIHSSPCLSDFCKVVARGLLGGMNDKTQPPSVAYLHPSLWLQQMQPTLLPMATCIGVSTGYASAVAATEAVEAVVKPWHCPARTALRTCVSFLVTTRAGAAGTGELQANLSQRAEHDNLIGQLCLASCLDLSEHCKHGGSHPLQQNSESPPAPGGRR